MSHLKPRTTSVTIYQGDDLDRLGELRREADLAERIAQEALDKAEAQAANPGPRRTGDSAPDLTAARAAFEAACKPTRDAFDAFVDDAAERALIVWLRSIGRRRFVDLVAEHPARKVAGKGESEPETVHEEDRLFNVNTETFPSALLTYIDADYPEFRTITEPGFKGRAEVQAFLDDEIAEGDFDKLWMAAYWLNRTPGADPKAVRYSTASPRSSES